MQYIKSCLLLLLLLGVSSSFAQSSQEQQSKDHINPMVKQEFMLMNDTALIDWLSSNLEPGIKIEDNQMLLSEEAIRIIKDEKYRSEIYKDNYTFEDLKSSLENLELQRSFWYLINLYDQYPEFMIKIVIEYDKVFPMDRMLIGAFYTYAYLDPKITNLEGDNPVVYRPDLLDEYLIKTKEIIRVAQLVKENESEPVSD